MAKRSTARALVRLRSDGSATLVPAGGAPRDFPDIGSALVRAGAGVEATLVVPGTAVRLLSLPVPRRNRSVFLGALPFAIEDLVATPTDTLDIVAARPGRDSVVVAVADTSLVSSWRQQARDAGIRLAAILPEPVCLPRAADGRWTVMFDGAFASVRCDPAPGFGCDAEALPDLLERRRRESGIAAPGLLVQGDGPVPQGWPVTRAGPPYDPVHFLDIGSGAASGPDLAGAGPEPARERTGQRALAVALATVAVALAGVAVMGRLQMAALDERILETRRAGIAAFRTALPSEPTVLDPRRQLQAYLTRQERRRAEARRFAALALTLDAAVADAPGTRLHAFTLGTDGYRLEFTGSRAGFAANFVERAEFPGAATASSDGGRLVLLVPR